MTSFTRTAGVDAPGTAAMASSMMRGGYSSWKSHRQYATCSWGRSTRLVVFRLLVVEQSRYAMRYGM